MNRSTLAMASLVVPLLLTLDACGGDSDGSGGAGGSGGSTSVTMSAGVGGGSSTATTGSGGLLCEPGGWTRTPLADAKISGMAPSLAADGAGALHLGYLRSTSVGYARRDPDGTWTDELAADVSQDYVAIAVDAAGGVHIAGAEYSGPVRYLERAPGGGWLPVVEISQSSNGDVVAIAIDNAGRPHLLYSKSGVQHAERASDGTWGSAPIGDDFPGAIQPTLAIDGDTLRACHKTASGILCWERAAPGAWTNTHSLSAIGPVYRPSLAVDPAARLHLTYAVANSPPNINVDYRELPKPTGQPLAEATLDTGDAAAFAPPSHIVADAKGALHVLWAISLGNGSNALRHARRDAGSNTWVTSTIDCDVDFYSGLALTQDGPHVVYADKAFALTYARPE